MLLENVLSARDQMLYLKTIREKEEGVDLPSTFPTILYFWASSGP
jgi:hypothetical protein